MTEPLISVIVPVYKVEQYLEKCINSIVNQTYKNLEIILVDDGSPDNCPAMCDEWAKKDNRITVIHTENNGVSSARNTGLKTYKGDYVVFIDSDDWVDSDYIEILYNSLLQNGADVACVGFYYEHLDGETETVVSESKVISQDILSEYLYDRIRPEVCSKIFSRKIIGDLVFNTDNNYSEDVLFNYYICKKCKKLTIIGLPKYHYLQDSGNSSTTPYITHIRANSYKIYVSFINDCKGTVEYDAAVWRFTKSVLSILSRVIMVSEFCERYYDEIVSAVKTYTKDIFRNKSISARKKLIVLSLCCNKSIFIKTVRFSRKGEIKSNPL